MAEEIIIALVVIRETADTVTSVVKAMQVTKDFFDSFKGRNDRTDELIRYIKEVKESIEHEIHEAELQVHLGTVSASSKLWFRASGRILDISKFPVETSEQETLRNDALAAVADDLRDAIFEMDKAISYFESDRPKPQTPFMLGVYLLSYALLHAMSFTEGALFSVINKIIEVDAHAKRIRAIDDARGSTKKMHQDYKGFRARQIRLLEIKDPFPTGEYIITADSGGDSLIPNLTNNHWVQWDHPNITGQINDRVIETFWRESEIGGKLVPAVAKKWEILQLAAQQVLRSAMKSRKEEQYI